MASRALFFALSITVAAATTACPCIDRVATAGVPTVTRQDKTYYASAMQNYTLHEAGFGASCKKHMEPAHPACTNLTTGEELPEGVRAGWCDSPWCYVDPCTCNLTDVAGGPTTKTWLTENGVHPVMAYSYKNCEGGEFDESVFGHSGFDEAKYCPESGCICQSLPVTVPRITTPSGTEHIIAAKKDYYSFPGDFGASCKTHLETGDSRCFNLVTGEELPEGERADWCDSPWCFVDPCTCNLSDVAGGSSAAFRNEDGSDTIVGYSYDNCKPDSKVDSMNFGHSSFDKVAFCGGDLTCNHVKKIFKENQCCGNPAKIVPKPTWR